MPSNISEPQWLIHHAVLLTQEPALDGGPSSQWSIDYRGEMSVDSEMLRVSEPSGVSSAGLTGPVRGDTAWSSTVDDENVTPGPGDRQPPTEPSLSDHRQVTFK